MGVSGRVDILDVSSRRPAGRGVSGPFSRTRCWSIFPLVFLFLAFLNASLCATMAQAQQGKPGVVGLGDLVVTGFSGALPPPDAPPLPAGINELDETFIDSNGASLRIFDVTSPGGPPQAQLLNAPTKFQVFARDIGQVFGLALDASDPANIFAASTSVHGLQIVVPDADGDGRPERIKLGQPGARWMTGQFGEARGGGPGTVWKINGETGEITKFADILNGGAPNSGPGLGNIAYDAKRKQLFVSDLDTGLIHRLDMSGVDLGTYDHGLQGRPANGMNALPEDPASRLDITSPAFDVEDSGSWGLAAPGRRVWGLALRGDRLYYSVEEGPQIWSIGLTPDGDFAGDPRWELDVPADPKAYPVSDIAFQSSGHMILAQRGGIVSRYDYSQYHSPRKTRVLRYHLEAPDDPATPSRWAAAPDDYAIGFPGIHRNTSGGIAIGYGYKMRPDGSYGRGACEGTLWSTGDALRDNPVHGAKLAQGGPLNVHGLQGNALGLVQPKNVPPWETYFVDFDGQFDDPQASGHTGDVEIPRRCGGKRTDIMDLRILKRGIPDLCVVGKACPFQVEIQNVGTKTYSGPLVINDTAHNGARLVSHSPAAPGWNCTEPFPGAGRYECRSPGVTLKPGQKISLEMVFQMPPWWGRPVYSNCVELRVPRAGIDERPYNNRSCDYVPTIGPGHPLYAPDLQLDKYGLFGACDFFGLCEFAVVITNVGAAPYTGLLHVKDVVTSAGATLLDWSSKPEWNCALNGPGEFGCSTAAPVTLAPGEFRELIILVQGPVPAPGFTHVRNCAGIDWNGPPGDPNPHNEFACAEISSLPPGHPDARPTVLIQKDAQPTCSRAGAGNPWTCLFDVRIKNSGTAPLTGPIEFTDELSAHPATLLGFFGGPGAWNCVPVIGPPSRFTCTLPAIPGGLLPGDEANLMMGFQLPAATPVPSWELNTATIKWDNDGDGVDEDHQASAISLICDAGSGNCTQDLAVLKLPPAGACLKGDTCPFTVQVQNLANVNFPGPVIVTDIPDPGAGAPNVLTPGWACAPAGGSFTCSNPAPIPPGDTASFEIEFPILPGYASPLFENCAQVAPGPGNALGFNDYNCATAIVPFPDLAPWSPSSCDLGTDCQLDVKVDNKGKLPFVGAAGIRGTLSPAVKIKSITAQTPGLACKVTGFGTYECLGQILKIAPGDAAKLQFIAEIPASFPHRSITHTKIMFWPDLKVKDTNPENDTHKSIITIEQPEKPVTPPPPPPPPPPPVGEPDLAINKTANQTASRAGGPSGFTVIVSNVGTAPFSGRINVKDVINPSSKLTAASPPWSCSRVRGAVLCRHPATTLLPGQSKLLSLTFNLPRRAVGAANNCAELIWGSTGQTRRGLRDVQRELSARGFNPGPADGKMGGNTRNAIRAFESQQNLKATGRVNSALLNALFGAPGGGDANPANDRACARTSIIAAPPPQCTGGRSRNASGNCVCPRGAPIWTGRRCIAPPPPCLGGQFRDGPFGSCKCPGNKPVWTGKICVPRLPQPCFGGQTRNNSGICRCPSNKPIWTGKACIPRTVPPPPPPQCTGGRTQTYVGGRVICACPASAPVWTGVICIPKINVCSGGRTFSLAKKKCACPSSKPIWTGKTCTVISTFPIPRTGGGQITRPGTSEIGCSGGRKRIGNQCQCPPAKPQWTGSACIARVQIKPQLGPILKLPGGQIKLR